MFARGILGPKWLWDRGTKWPWDYRAKWLWDSPLGTALGDDLERIHFILVRGRSEVLSGKVIYLRSQRLDLEPYRGLRGLD